MGFFSDLGTSLNDIGNRYLGLPTSSDNAQADATNALNAESLAQTKSNNAAQLDLANRNMAMETDFAKNGISWRIADAAANGISPLAALGSAEPSYSPVAAVLQGDNFLAPPTPNQNSPVSGSGCGDGYGYGYDYGDGHGYGDGDGSGCGYGHGSGYG